MGLAEEHIKAETAWENARADAAELMAMRIPAFLETGHGVDAPFAEGRSHKASINAYFDGIYVNR